LSQNNRPKFIEDSDTEKVNEDEEEEEEEDVSITADLADVKVANSEDEDATENTQDYQFQFTHQFQENGNIVTPMENWEMLFPIFYVIQPMNFIRVKANLIPRAEKIVSHGLHIDTFTPYSITGIYYVNNNNGCTEFEDGDKVESKQNRIVLFPSNMQHTGTTCTDAKVRVAININFIPYVNEDSMYKEIFDATQWQAITKWCTK
jgi:hypothetical protein